MLNRFAFLGTLSKSESTTSQEERYLKRHISEPYQSLA